MTDSGDPYAPPPPPPAFPPLPQSALAEAPPPPAPVGEVAEMGRRVAVEMHKAVVGQDALIEMLTVAILAGGHVLLEGVPGTAKTLAVRALARVFRAPFARIQFTPDLMPSDILGTSVYDPRTQEFHLKRGPLFAGLVLADEINRTPPKTQAALLEAMEERRVTIDGVSHPLPEPFLVCATQNPVEFEGTYPLPEAQLDRFLLKVTVPYPSHEEENALLARVQAGFRAQDLDTAGVQTVLSAEELPGLRAEVARVTVAPVVLDYVVRLTRATRESRHVTLGASPRAAIALLNAAKAVAALRGRLFVTPDDVQAVARPALGHRLNLRAESEVEGFTSDRVLEAVFQTVPVPR